MLDNVDRQFKMALHQTKILLENLLARAPNGLQETARLLTYQFGSDVSFLVFRRANAGIAFGPWPS